MSKEPGFIVYCDKCKLTLQLPLIHNKNKYAETLLGVLNSRLKLPQMSIPAIKFKSCGMLSRFFICSIFINRLNI